MDRLTRFFLWVAPVLIGLGISLSAQAGTCIVVTPSKSWTSVDTAQCEARVNADSGLNDAGRCAPVWQGSWAWSATNQYWTRTFLQKYLSGTCVTLSVREARQSGIVCPANSTLNSTGDCVCDSGYIENGPSECILQCPPGQSMIGGICRSQCPSHDLAFATSQEDPTNKTDFCVNQSGGYSCVYQKGCPTCQAQASNGSWIVGITGGGGDPVPTPASCWSFTTTLPDYNSALQETTQAQPTPIPQAQPETQGTTSTDAAGCAAMGGSYGTVNGVYQCLNSNTPPGAQITSGSDGSQVMSVPGPNGTTSVTRTVQLPGGTSTSYTNNYAAGQTDCEKYPGALGCINVNDAFGPGDGSEMNNMGDPTAPTIGTQSAPSIGAHGQFSASGTCNYQTAISVGSLGSFNIDLTMLQTLANYMKPLLLLIGAFIAVRIGIS